MVFDIKHVRCANYEAYFSTGTKVTVLDEKPDFLLNNPPGKQNTGTEDPCSALSPIKH